MVQSGQSSFPLPLPHLQNPIHCSSNSSSGSSSSDHDSLFSPSPSAPDSSTITPRTTPEPHKQHSLDGQQGADAELELWQQEGEQAAYQQQQQGVPSSQPRPQRVRFRPYPPELYTQAYTYYYPYTHSTATHGHLTGAASHRDMVPADIFHSPYNAYAVVMGQQQGSPGAGTIQQPAQVESFASSWGASKGKRRASDDGPAGSTKKQKQPRIRPDVDPNLKFIGEINGQRTYECQLAHCNRVRMQESSTYHHRTSNGHTQGSKNFLCDMCGRYLSRSDSLLRHKKSPACKAKQEENARKGTVPSTNEPGPSTASGSSSTASPSATVPTGQFTFQEPRPSPSLMAQQAPPFPICTPAGQPAAQAPITVLNASGARPLPGFAQDVQILAKPSRPESRMVSQQATGFLPPPIVAADFSINVREREGDDDRDLFGSPKISNSLALAQAQVAQEGTTVTDLPASSSAPMYDESVLSTSFDDWFKEVENALPAVYADSTMDACTFV